MKTLLISSGDLLPDTLRKVIERGSTSVEERTAREIDPGNPLPASVDRVVFWAPQGEDALRRVAARFARAERQAGRHVIVYVTSQGQPAAEGVASEETYVWPRDEDKLIMAFMTSG